MRLINGSLILFVAYFVAQPSASNAHHQCKLGELHGQAKFCRSDFVIEADIIGRNYTGESGDLTVSITKLYKVPAIGIYSLGKLYLDHQTFKDNKYFYESSKYVLSGYIVNGRAMLDRCDSIIRRSNSLTLEQQELLERHFGNNCNCDVIHKDEAPKSDMTCSWNSYSHGPSEICKDLASVCQPIGSSRCAWDIGSKYQKCLGFFGAPVFEASSADTAEQGTTEENDGLKEGKEEKEEEAAESTTTVADRFNYTSSTPAGLTSTDKSVV